MPMIDLLQFIKQSDINLYADDTALFASAESVGDLSVILNDDLSAIADWLQSNRICINFSKSVSMLIGSAHSLKHLPPFNVSINGNVLTSVEMVKYLGVYVDCHLTWDKHIENLCQRARSKLSAIQRLLPLASRVITLLYNAYVLPIFDYCDVVWNPTSAKLSSPIDKIHKRALKLMNSSNNPFVSPTSTSNLSLRRDFHLLIQVFKCIKGLSPSYLSNTFGKSKNRFAVNRLFIPAVRTSYGRYSFYFRGAHLWNKLKANLYNCSKLQNFITV